MKRSIRIAGHRTSISLEKPFWDGLREIAAARARSLAALVAEIDAARGEGNLSSALRLYVLDRARAGELGPGRARDGPPLSGADSGAGRP